MKHSSSFYLIRNQIDKSQINKQSKSRTPKGKRKKNNKQENEFGDKNNLETGLK